MNFNRTCSLDPDFAKLLGFRGLNRWQAAFAKGTNPSTRAIHRQWVKDVIEAFADKAYLTRAQATQIVVTNCLKYAIDMHQERGKKLRREMMQTYQDGKYPAHIYNPIREIESRGEMLPHDHITMLRAAWSLAVSIRHPHDHVDFGSKKDAA